MSELVPTGSKYTDSQRLAALRQYAIDGVFTKTSQVTGIPERTLNDWGKQDWFIEGLATLRAEMQEQHIAQYQQITTKALDHAINSIDKLDAKSAVLAAAVATDKSRLLMNQPTSIRGDSSKINDLAAQFRQLSTQWEEKQANVVSTQTQGEDA